MGELEELLLFYREAGVDAALGETPVDRLADAPAAPQPAPSQRTGQPEPGPAVPVQSSDRPGAAVPDEAQVERARELAAQASSLDELRDLLAGFDGCNLKFTAKTLVFGDGNPRAPLMAIGEAPGREEDLQGLPFVGRSGRLLNRMLEAIGRDRTSTYITNVIPWRPPGNRTPTPHETEICRPFIERHIELVAPNIIATLGNPSTKLILGTTQGIMRMRGQWHSYRTASGTEIAVMPTLHPAYLLRNPAHKRLAWRDFLEIKARLNQIGAD